MQKRFSLYLKERNEMEKLLKEEKLVLSSEVFEDCFWEKYIGTDRNFTFPLKNYYKGSSSFQLTLVIITEVVAYDPVRRKPTCKTLADIVKQAVRGHSWVPENVWVGDYERDNKDRWLGCIYEILENVVEKIDLFSSIFKDEYPWNSAAAKEANITKDVFLRRNYLEICANNYKDKIQNNKLSPEQAVDLIIENFEFMYQNQSTYEALIFCLLMSNGLNEKEFIMHDLRNFCKKCQH